jgi:hypothetical protein
MSSQIGPLAKIHHPIGNSYPTAKTPADLKQFEIPEEQVRAYHETGFVGPVRVLDMPQVERLRESLERMIAADFPFPNALLGRPRDGWPQNPADRKGVIYFQGQWTVEEAAHDLVFNPRIIVPVCQLLGTSSARFFHDQTFWKPQRHGGVVAWNQDYSYWTRTGPVGHVTCFVALDDTTLENGCLHLVPGSHRWNLLPKVTLTGQQKEDMDSIKSVMTPEQLAQFKPVPMFLKAGECSFHHSLTLHGSYANGSDRPRRSLVLNYMKPDTISNSDEPLMPGAAIVPKGNVVEGELFPLAGSR